jgi:hypothetical protein
MRTTLGLAFISMAWLSSAAAQEIRIDQAGFEDGLLVVRGEILAISQSQTVTLDRKFTTSSSPDGKFSFRIRHTPFMCQVLLQVGGASQSAKVDNCMMDDRVKRDLSPLLRPR